MARNRMIRPEFWEDDKIGECSPTARLLFIAMWNFADDEGYLEYRPKWLKAKCFPYDNIMIEPLIQELLDKERIEIHGNIIWIKNFLKHQKIEKPKPSDLSQKFKDSPNVPRILPEHSPPKIEEKLREIEVKRSEVEVKTFSNEKEASPQNLTITEIIDPISGTYSTPPIPTPPPSKPKLPKKEYGNQEINETLDLLKQVIGIDDFKNSQEKQRWYANHILNLSKKIKEKHGDGEFLRRLNLLLADKYKSSKCNDIISLYEEMKGFKEPQFNSITL